MEKADYPFIDLAGRRYVILPEADFLALRDAKTAPSGSVNRERDSEPDPLDPSRIAARLVEWRQRVGLSQSELARRAELRIETVNRLERGRTAPDFATVRKLVTVLRQVETTLEASGKE